MKNCIICNIEQALDQYYVHKKMSDGHINKCKNCCKAQSKAREVELRKDPAWTDKERARTRDKYQRLGHKKPNPEAKKIADYKYKMKYPEKYKASIANQRNRDSNGKQSHHWSYASEHLLDVILLTVKEHRLLHRNMDYVQKSMCYRRKDSLELMTTKLQHLQFIKDLGILI